jgi:hypothetical protein
VGIVTRLSNISSGSTRLWPEQVYAKPYTFNVVSGLWIMLKIVNPSTGLYQTLHLYAKPYTFNVVSGLWIMLKIVNPI